MATSQALMTTRNSEGIVADPYVVDRVVREHNVHAAKHGELMREQIRQKRVDIETKAKKERFNAHLASEYLHNVKLKMKRDLSPRSGGRDNGLASSYSSHPGNTKGSFGWKNILDTGAVDNRKRLLRSTERCEVVDVEAWAEQQKDHERHIKHQQVEAQLLHQRLQQEQIQSVLSSRKSFSATTANLMTNTLSSSLRPTTTSSGVSSLRLASTTLIPKPPPTAKLSLPNPFTPLNSNLQQSTESGPLNALGSSTSNVFDFTKEISNAIMEASSTFSPSAEGAGGSGEAIAFSFSPSRQRKESLWTPKRRSSAFAHIKPNAVPSPRSAESGGVNKMRSSVVILNVDESPVLSPALNPLGTAVSVSDPAGSGSSNNLLKPTKSSKRRVSLLIPLSSSPNAAVVVNVPGRSSVDSAAGAISPLNTPLTKGRPSGSGGKQIASDPVTSGILKVFSSSFNAVPTDATSHGTSPRRGLLKNPHDPLTGLDANSNSITLLSGAESFTLPRGSITTEQATGKDVINRAIRAPIPPQRSLPPSRGHRISYNLGGPLNIDPNPVTDTQNPLLVTNLSASNLVASDASRSLSNSHSRPTTPLASSAVTHAPTIGGAATTIVPQTLLPANSTQSPPPPLSGFAASTFTHSASKPAHAINNAASFRAPGAGKSVRHTHSTSKGLNSGSGQLGTQLGGNNASPSSTVISLPPPIVLNNLSISAVEAAQLVADFMLVSYGLSHALVKDLREQGPEAKFYAGTRELLFYELTSFAEKEGVSEISFSDFLQISYGFSPAQTKAMSARFKLSRVSWSLGLAFKVAERVHEAYQTLTDNGSIPLTFGQLKNFVKNAVDGKTLTVDGLLQIFHKVDADGDGILNKDEFAALFLSSETNIRWGSA